MKQNYTIEACLKEMLKGKMLNESNRNLLESLLDKTPGVDSPANVKDFMDKNAENIAQTELKLKGKEKTWFKKACEFVKYAINKGLSFVEKHWLTILKLIAIILIGMWAYKLYPLVSDTISRLFDKNYNIANAVNKANNDIQAHSRELQDLQNTTSDAIDTISGGNERLKDKMMKKVGDVLNKTGIEGAKDVLSNPDELRRSTSRPGNVAILR